MRADPYVHLGHGSKDTTHMCVDTSINDMPSYTCLDVGVPLPMAMQNHVYSTEVIVTINNDLWQSI